MTISSSLQHVALVKIQCLSITVPAQRLYCLKCFQQKYLNWYNGYFSDPLSVIEDSKCLENVPENQNEIDQTSGKLVEQHRGEIQDMLLNHLIDVKLVFEYLFLSDYYRLNTSWGFRQYHYWHWKSRDPDSHVTQFLHMLHLCFLFLFVCNFHHNLTSNSMLRCHMTRCCSKYSFELSCLFPRWWVWVHNESDAFDQSFWYFGIGMFCTESGFSLTLPKLRLEVCCQGKVHSRHMNGVEKVHCHLTRFCIL